MEVLLRHRITYATQQDVPVTLVAESLLANERFIHEALGILEECVPTLRISAVRVSVREVSNGSPLKNLLVAALVVTWQSDLVTEVPDLIRSLTGYDVPERMDTLVTLLVCIAAIYVADGVIERVFPGRSTKELKRELQTTKAIVAKLLDMSLEDIQKAIELRITEPKKLSLWSRARDFFGPAKAESASIVVANQYTLPGSLVAEVPDAELPSDGPAVSYELKNATLEIHRSDMDQNEHGWRAVLRDVSDKKVRLVLAPEISAGELYGAKFVVGDVVVVSAVKPDGTDGEPMAYHLERVAAQPSEVGSSGHDEV